tara:strand:+ start:453 stop:728 length:276 start_codon:yes stop_codon:yes gene_type:complete
MRKEIPPSVSKLAKSEAIDVSIRIGKGGVTDALLSELSEQLSRRSLIKVKANKRTTSDREHRKEIFSKIAEQSNSTVVFQRGNVAVLWSGK